MSSSSSSEYASLQGLYPRQTKPTALWAHLLRKEALAPLASAQMPIPPVTPVDRNSTSMRVLLHDTQANFEKFSVRVDALVSEIVEARLEIKTSNTLFERDREALVAELTELVNRSQRQIQLSLGAPCQASNLDRVGESVEQRLDSLNQRLDMLQMLLKHHSEALQTQTRCLQSLQDQQAAVINAVLPLPALIQAVPLKMEAQISHLSELQNRLYGINEDDSGTAVKPGNKRSRSNQREDDLSTLLVQASSKRRRQHESFLGIAKEEYVNRRFPTDTHREKLNSSRQSLCGVSASSLQTPMRRSSRIHGNRRDLPRRTPSLSFADSSRNIPALARVKSMTPFLNDKELSSGKRGHTPASSATPQLPNISSLSMATTSPGVSPVLPNFLETTGLIQSRATPSLPASSPKLEAKKQPLIEISISESAYPQDHDSATTLVISPEELTITESTTAVAISSYASTAAPLKSGAEQENFLHQIPHSPYERSMPPPALSSRHKLGNLEATATRGFPDGRLTRERRRYIPLEDSDSDEIED